jgi:Signal transduction histidine kinase
MTNFFAGIIISAENYEFGIQQKGVTLLYSEFFRSGDGRVFQPVSLVRRAYLVIAAVVIASFIFLGFQHAQYVRQQVISETMQSLLRIAAVLEQCLPESYEALLDNAPEMSAIDKRRILNEKLQPILRQVAVNNPGYSFGYYAKDLDIVALIPENSRQLGAPASPAALRIYDTSPIGAVFIPADFNQDGQRVLSVNYPLYHRGEIIGHIWVNAKIEELQALYISKLVGVWGTLFVILLLILLSVWWLNWNHKTSLAKLAERIKQDEEEALTFSDEFPQIQPLLETVAVLRRQLREKYAAKERAAAEMARLDRLNLIGEMAAGVAHEIRNPLTVIRGYVQRMKQKSDNNSPGSGQYTIILEEIDQINKILTAFLSLAKNRRVKIKLHNINHIITNIMPLIEANAAKAGISLRFELSERPLMVYADDKEIRQLVQNLTCNAMEATPAKGVLLVKTTLAGNAVCLTIADTGEGIAPWHIEKIFDPFFTTKDNGTGLGLAICKSIIDRHNGSINVQSQRGAGTTFIIEIPAAA